MFLKQEFMSEIRLLLNEDILFFEFSQVFDN